MKKYSAVILAGRTQNDNDPLLVEAGVENKALIELEGKKMISYVIQAVEQSERIDRAVVVGLEKYQIDYEPQIEIDFIPADGEDRVDTIFTGYKHFSKTQNPEDHLILLPSDIPLISGEMIDDCINSMAIGETKKEAYFGVVYKSDYEKKFPHSNRSWRYLKDGTIAGGDIHAVKIKTMLDNQEFISNLISQRKSFVTMILKNSPMLILRYFTKQLAIKHIVNFVRKSMKIDATQYRAYYPETGMDLDYPDQLPKFINYIKNKRFE